MRTVAALVCVLASVSAADSVDYLESGSLSLLQTAAEVKGHNHVSAEWLPGSGYVVNKCGEGGNLADIRPDLAGWTGGDAHAVGTQKIDNADTPEGCIENVLKDSRCQIQDRKAEIDARNNQPEYVARNKPFAYNIAAGYAPGQGKCFCSWGTVESQKDGTNNPMQSGWITCIATAEKKKKVKDPIPPNPNTPTYELKKNPIRKFGPDGTWATPFCKSLLGCMPYCPDGCNGTAYWEASGHAPGLGNADRDDYDASNPGAHFLTCVQGESRGVEPRPDYKIKVHGGNVKCLNSENATKKSPYKDTWTDAEKVANGQGAVVSTGKSWNAGGWLGDGAGWGNEYCPKGCVNDCVAFKLGGFLTCGVTPAAHVSGWFGYDGARSNANGPNKRCPQNVVSAAGGYMAWTWCGEPKAKKEPVPDDFTCDVCEGSDNEFDPTGKRGKCEKINERAQKSPKACEKRKNRAGVKKRCCPDPPVECPLCSDGQEFKFDNLDGKCSKIAARSTRNEALCNKLKGQKRVQKRCCGAPAKDYTKDDFELTKANECPEGTKEPDYKTCHDQAGNYQWPGQPAGHTQRWDEEDHDPEFGVGWTFMPPGCVLYTGWPTGSHAAQVRWNPNQNGKNDGHRAKVCEKA